MKQQASVSVVAALLLNLTFACFGLAEANRPNILYIALEDITPMMGCYGDDYAKTPNFDKLAEEGIRYTNAHSVAPVCSVSRSSIVTGMYPSTIGTMHHRSGGIPAPAFLRFVPNLMSDAGYYTTNRKGDFNIVGMKYDKQGKKGEQVPTPWRSRPDKSQPFFSKIDFGECHSSVTKTPEQTIVAQRLNRLQPGDFHDPAKVPLPSFHPDDPVFRKAWARYYDAVTQVDYRAGEVIAALKKDGLWDNTIVIVWADHGVGMPRGKHTAWEQGTHVPLIIRFPEKYQHLAPAKRGAVVDDLVCLMDMAPSVLTFAGIESPDYMQGRALLCKGDVKKREFLVAVRNRLDTRTQFVRSIRDKRYRYMRHFFPHRPYAPYETYQWEAPIYDRFQQLALAGKLEGPQVEYAERFKAVEQLYDSKNDPEMVHNLAADPDYADVLTQMRQRLHDWMIETRDLALVEERELYVRAKGRSLWKVGQEIESYERILETANLQLQGDSALAELMDRSTDADPLVRYWAALGLIVITQTAEREVVEKILPSLNKSLGDKSIDVRLLAAEGLFNLGYYKKALPVIIAEMTHPDTDVQVRVGNILDSQPPDANEQLAAAIGPLAVAMRKFKPSGRYGDQNKPFERAYRAITGQQLYFRWGMGASGSPKSPLIAVQKKPFVAKPSPRVEPMRRRSELSRLATIGGKIAAVSSFHPGHEPDHMLDGDPATFWHTRFRPDLAKEPHFVVLQIPADKSITGLVYIPRTKPNGRVLSYEVTVSADGKRWSIPVAKGKVQASATEQHFIKISKPTDALFVKLTVTNAVSAGGQSIAAIGELDVVLSNKP